MKKIGIVIPAFNEDENIIYLIKKIKKKLNCLILIVDDSSNQNTKKLLNNHNFKNVKYFNRGKKLGRGSAIIFGFKKLLKIKKDINCLIEMDADMSHNPDELKRNISYFYKNSYDLLIGSRYLPDSKIINWPLSRRILSKLSNNLAKFLLEAPINDYTNGYRFYSKNAAKIIIKKCKNTDGGFIILSEIILILWKNNFKIAEVKSIFKNRIRGESSVNLKLILESLLGLIKLYIIKKSFKI
tara:strand:+ start:368 stop:1090 length:723 start_codon:yes stop_codon:yes gene_type:complete